VQLQGVADLDLEQLCQRSFHPSPVAWEDEVLYFLMLDRFSDGREDRFFDNFGNLVQGGTTPLFDPAVDAHNAPLDDWRHAGGGWCGGTLRGLATKLGYLKRLGVTAVWISPVLKQVAFAPTYHGYGTQDFLDVDPHFGTRDDLRDVVAAAHALGIRVVLDIVLNHAGNVFGYDADRYFDPGQSTPDPRWDGRPYRVAGFRDATGATSLPFAPVDLTVHPDAWPDAAVWPRELQEPGVFTCAGRIRDWDGSPESLEGDFYDLKNVQLGHGPVDDFVPSPALRALAEVYKFWIAWADLDGYRIDTVKHMETGAMRWLASALHEFAQSIGKDRFYLIGEITGGRDRAFETLEETGIDAALGIGDVSGMLVQVAKGGCDANEYFRLFRNSLQVHKESHVWFRDRVVTMVDDHDQVGRDGRKARFAADAPALALAALALNATSLGIPCLYYGSEQGFDGAGDGDRYLRECMFGGAFGSFQSHERHFFHEQTWLFGELAKILALRASRIALRRGRQYLREISGDGVGFGLPVAIGGRMLSVVPWSRILDRAEIVCAFNTDSDAPRTAWVTIDDGLHRGGDVLRCVYSTDPMQLGTTVEVEARNGKAITLNVPPAGFVVFE
jgi:glycosidase